MDRLQAGDPEQIGSFTLLGRLGEGGMGRVYLGESPGGRKIAIKVMHPHYASDPDFRRRFAREVAMARRVGGFHTAGVMGADPGGDPPWMATAYIPGPSLADAVAAGGPLDETRVRRLGAALAEGLTAIHDCGLIHRDLKPGNVILADDGPRIIDFGIARGADATALTGSGAVIGTLRYMSPEQLNGRKLTSQSDVFALGTVLAYAATGHDPFQGPTIPAVITRILTDPPDLDPLTGHLRGIIGDCLAKNPDGRPSPGDLLVCFGRPAPHDPTVIATPAPVPAAVPPLEPGSADASEPEQPVAQESGSHPATVAALGPPTEAASAVATETSARHPPDAALDFAQAPEPSAPAPSPARAPDIQPPRRRQRMRIAAVAADVPGLAGIAGPAHFGTPSQVMPTPAVLVPALPPADRRAEAARNAATISGSLAVFASVGGCVTAVLARLLDWIGHWDPENPLSRVVPQSFDLISSEVLLWLAISLGASIFPLIAAALHQWRRARRLKAARTDRTAFMSPSH